MNILESFPGRRFLGVEEMAKYLDLAKGTLYVWVCYKKIPYTKIGKAVKFDLQEIETWLKEKKVRNIP